MITEFVAVTVLVIYSKFLTQLNYYHKHLHEDEIFLSSVNLLDKFSKSYIKDEMLKEIIRSELNLNENKEAFNDVPIE